MRAQTRRGVLSVPTAVLTVGPGGGFAVVVDGDDIAAGVQIEVQTL